MVTRAVLDTGYRMVFPFLPVFARGLDVEIQAVSLVLAARSSMGLLSPLLGAFADTGSRKRGLLFGLGFVVVGALAVFVWQTFLAFFVGLLVYGAGKVIFDSSMHAYLGDQVEQARRGAAVALAELGWSVALLIGAPAVGWIISRHGWPAPFGWLAALGIFLIVATWRLIPSEAERKQQFTTSSMRIRSILSSRTAMGVLGVVFFLAAGNAVLMVILGVWLEGSFQLNVAGLGLATAVIGMAELGGEGLLAGLADRMGRLRALATGIACTIGFTLLLPVLGTTLPFALVGLFLLFVSFEFGVLSAYPLVLDLMVDARATMVAAVMAALQAGYALGTLMGPTLFERGLWLTSLASAALSATGLAVMWVFVLKMK